MHDFGRKKRTNERTNGKKKSLRGILFRCMLVIPSLCVLNVFIFINGSHIRFSSVYRLVTEFIVSLCDTNGFQCVWAQLIYKCIIQNQAFHFEFESSKCFPENEETKHFTKPLAMHSLFSLLHILLPVAMIFNSKQRPTTGCSLWGLIYLVISIVDRVILIFWYCSTCRI